MKIIKTQTVPAPGSRFCWGPQDKVEITPPPKKSARILKVKYNQNHDESGRFASSDSSGGPANGDGVSADAPHGVNLNGKPRKPGDPGLGFTADQMPGAGKGVTDYTPVDPNGKDTQQQFVMRNPDGSIQRDANGEPVYTPERQALHDQIVNYFMATGATPVDAANRTAVILGGGSASGKSSLDASQAPDKSNAVTINADDIRAQLPEYIAMKGNLNAANFSHEEASDITKQLQAVAQAGERNIVLDGTGNSTLAKLSGKIDSMTRAGYNVSGVYVTTSVAIAKERAYSRFQKTGRGVMDHILEGNHQSVSEIFPHIVASGKFSTTKLYDTTNSTNTNRNSELIASATGNHLTIHNAAAYRTFLDKAKGGGP